MRDSVTDSLCYDLVTDVLSSDIGERTYLLNRPLRSSI